MEEKDGNKKEKINYYNKNLISIINYLENPFTKHKIKSPRSLKSMDNLGYKMDDIIYLSFPEFLDKYKETKKFPENVQNKKYECYEQMRQIKINNIKIERDRLIQELGDNIPNPINKNENTERKKVIKNLKNVEAELEKKIFMKGNNKYEQKEKMMERKKRREEKEIERKKQLEEQNIKRMKQEEEYQKKEAIKERLRIEEKIKKEKELEIKRQKFEEKVEKIHKDFNDKRRKGKKEKTKK